MIIIDNTNVDNNKKLNNNCDKEKQEIVKEIEKMINNIEKYPRYDNREELKKALLNDE